MTRWLVPVLSIVIAAARIFGVKHEAFQAAAHLFVGGLAGAWLVERRWLFADWFVGLCIVEILCFLADRFP